MNRLTCAVDGCTTVFHTDEAISPQARFICKNHDEKTQVETARRPYEERTDLAHRDVHFQDYQFDPKLNPDPAKILPLEELAAISNADRHVISGGIKRTFATKEQIDAAENELIELAEDPYNGVE